MTEPRQITEAEMCDVMAEHGDLIRELAEAFSKMTPAEFNAMEIKMTVRRRMA